jgi:hypothetical protein
MPSKISTERIMKGKKMASEPNYEIRIAASFYSGKWYPEGSDTPVPAAAVVEVYDGGVIGPEDLT